MEAQMAANDIFDPVGAAFADDEGFQAEIAAAAENWPQTGEAGLPDDRTQGAAAEDDILLLAKLDLNNTPVDKLMVIFQCSLEDLEAARALPEYKEELSRALKERAARGFGIDDDWDAIEKRALGGVREFIELGGMTDVKDLMRVAMASNRAARRDERKGASGGGRGGGQADPLTADQKTVVKLRTRIVERLNHDDGHERIMRRDVQIEASAGHKIDEDFDPREMHAHIAKSLGTSSEDHTPGGQQGTRTILQEMEAAFAGDPAMFAKPVKGN
jgi:hypothetical protein